MAMVADILTGLIAAFITKSVSSTVSWAGMSRKVGIWIVVGLCAGLEPLANGIPLAHIACLFYIGTEGLSIVENLAHAGVPLPPRLIDVLHKLKEAQGRPGVVIQEPSAVIVQGPSITRVEAGVMEKAAEVHDPDDPDSVVDEIHKHGRLH